MTEYLYDHFTGNLLDGLNRREEFHKWFKSLGLPEFCQECRRDWVEYAKKVVTEDASYDEVVRIEPAYVIKWLTCERGHRHAWVEYVDGWPLTPSRLTEYLIAREFEDEETIIRRQHG